MLDRSLVGLEKVLERRVDGKHLIYSVNKIREKSIPILAKINETFPEFTIHDVRHSESVLGILEWLLPKDLVQKMNSYELYFLIVSCYLHDIGMANLAELAEKELKTLKDENLKKDYIRKNHHMRSEKFITSKFQELGIDDEHQARLIGRICRGHRENVFTALYSNREMYTSKNISINIPMLAMLLQISDDLDITFERTPILIYEQMKMTNQISQQEWARHLKTCGVGIDPENKSRVIIRATCWDLRIHRSIKTLELKIQEKLDSFTDVMFQYREVSSKFPQRILAIIEPKGYEVVDLKFKLQEKEITTLLMGERLYDRKEASIRELLQNSYDACRFRMATDKGVKPKVFFQLSNDRSKLSVIDNGVGMDRDKIEKYFIRIGSSFYNSEEFLQKGQQFSPISSFGLGMLSCFMIADHVTFESKAQGEQAQVVEIDGLDDYFLMKTSEKESIGTTVTLYLKKEISPELDLEKELRTYARHLDFPISVILPDGSEKKILNEREEPKSEYLADQDFVSRYKLGFKTFHVQNEKFEAFTSFLIREDQGYGFFPFWTGYWGTQNKSKNKIVLSSEGVYVGEINNILPVYLRSIHMDINIKKSALDLTVSRNNFVKNEKAISLTDELETHVLECLQKWICELDPQKVNSRLINSLTKDYFNNEIFEDPENRRYLSKDFKASQRLKDFIKRNYLFKIVHDNVSEYWTYEMLEKERKELIQIRGAPSITPNYATNLLAKCDNFNPNQFYYLQNYSETDITNFCDETKSVFKTSQTFSSFIIRKKVKTPLRSIFPKTYDIVKFENLKSDRIFEFFGGGYNDKTWVNVDNKFINLLLSHPNVITKDSGRIAYIESFFIKFKILAKSNIIELKERQKNILKWYVDEGIIKNINEFLLKNEEVTIRWG